MRSFFVLAFALVGCADLIGAEFGAYRRTADAGEDLDAGGGRSSVSGGSSSSSGGVRHDVAGGASSSAGGAVGTGAGGELGGAGGSSSAGGGTGGAGSCSGVDRQPVGCTCPGTGSPCCESTRCGCYQEHTATCVQLGAGGANSNVDSGPPCVLEDCPACYLSERCCKPNNACGCQFQILPCG
jgi:hypothetical protein